MSLSREHARKGRDTAPHLATAEVDAAGYEDDLPEGETLRLRELTGRERWIWGRLSGKAQDDESLPDPLSVIIVMSAVDDDGNKLWESSDAEWLQHRGGAFINRASEKVMELSGLAAEPKKALADAVGNSGKTESDSSSSDSPASTESSPTS